MMTIHQYGEGDRILGDVVLGDKIGVQINQFDIVPLILDPKYRPIINRVRIILTDLSEEFNPNAQRGQIKIRDAAIARLNDQVVLKQSILEIVKEFGCDAVVKKISHPVAHMLISTLLLAIKQE